LLKDKGRIASHFSAPGSTVACGTSPNMSRRPPWRTSPDLPDT